MAKPAPAPLPMTHAQCVAETLAAFRARKIREARERVPTPSYDDIAVECGCSPRTVYNVLHGITHAQEAPHG
jgi:predicted transcriptional regulator